MARIEKGFSKQLVMSVVMAALLLIMFLATAGACSRTAAKLIEAKNRAVEYYEDVRFVYRIATRFKHLEAQNEAAERTSARNDKNLP